MFNLPEFIELLKAVTVDCKDNGKEFTVTTRVEVIENLLKDSAYKLVAREPLSLVYAKRELREGESVALVSSHVDCLYENCFCSVEEAFLRGTFDNSFGNAAILWMMLHDMLPDNVVVAFTGDEERDSQGAVQTVLALGRMQCKIKFALVLEVTNVGWGRGAHFALENDNGIDLLTAYSIVETVRLLGAEYVFEHNAEPDESWDYSNYGIPSLTLSMPVGGNMHSNEGVLLHKEAIDTYCQVLSLLPFLF